VIHPYASLAYSRSIGHWGQAFEVPEWGSTVISRVIDEFDLCDAAGPYPLTVLCPKADLAGGLERLRQAGFVSVTLVLDDFHRPSLTELESGFDLVRPFKTHYIVNRAVEEALPTRHHRYEIRKALAAVRVERFPLSRYLEQWVSLYGHLIQRHALQGIHNFPRCHHETLATLPGVTAVGAFLDDVLLAAHLWVEADGFVHSHLAASSEQGYALGAAYAINDASIKLFSSAHIVNLGGGAGHGDDPSDGLARFKKGFVNATARSYICGKILDVEAYRRLSDLKTPTAESGFFPAYRSPAISRHL